MAKSASKAAGKAPAKGAPKAAAKGASKTAAKPTGKAAAKPAATKTAKAPKEKAPKTPRKPNPALMKLLTPSSALAGVVGSAPLPRPEVVSKVWDYIKKNGLQDARNKREINADPKLEKVFGKKKVTMFEMNKFLAAHLK
jgi:chromatin remodeling complex protein RSC6